MRNTVPSPAPARSAEHVRPAEHARDLQARLYREIGISAVAAALRFTTQPEPVAVAEAAPARPVHRATLAA